MNVDGHDQIFYIVSRWLVSNKPSWQQILERVEKWFEYYSGRHAYYQDQLLSAHKITSPLLFWSGVCSPFIWPQLLGYGVLVARYGEQQEADRLNWHAKWSPKQAWLLAMPRIEIAHTVIQFLERARVLVDYSHTAAAAFLFFWILVLYEFAT